MKVPVVLQSLGLAGLALASLILWGVGVALLAAALGALVAGVALERDRTLNAGVTERLMAAFREYERTH